MASASPALVLYAGSAATYVCESGDVQPTFPHLPAITEDLLRLLQSSSLSSSSSTPSAVAAVADRHPSHQQRRSAATIREHLFPMLRQCTLFLVLPLVCTASYQEAWVRLCFHADVAVHRLLVLSDTVADSFACGQGNCLVLHASLHTISVSRVEAGCSTRYSNSRVGSVQALCGEAATATLATELPRTAAAISAAAPPHSSSEIGEEEEEEDIAAEVCARGGAEMGIDLSAAEYRDSLVHAFGYHAYRAVVVVPQQEHLDRETRGTGKGKGRGKGRAASSSPSLLHALKHAYSRAVREAPGQVEKLVARVVHGETATFSEAGEPCILAGEALAVPLLAQLFTHVLRRCGGETWSAVEEERKAKQRRQHATSADAGAGQEQGEDPAQKRHKAEASSSSSSESGSDDTSSDGEDSEEDDAWLTLQPTPLPRAPWWLPLLGGSVVSRLGDRDLLRLFITEEEARESNGTIVHWKTLQ